jgi:hypothetical protein
LQLLRSITQIQALEFLNLLMDLLQNMPIIKTSIVNPMAMIESACMMLDYIEEKEKAKKIRKAMATVISKKEKFVLTI